MLFERRNVAGSILNLIRIGEVSSINPEKCTARVVFDDDDGMVSYDLPILQRNTLDTKDFHSVNVGEDVLCLFLDSGHEDGFIIGSFYAGEIDVPERSENRRTTVFKDGTRITYDMDTHCLEAVIEGTSLKADRQNIAAVCPNAASLVCDTAQVKAATSVKVDTPISTFTGNVQIDGALTVVKSITGSGGFAISGGSGATATINGTLKATGDVEAGNISLMSHVHTEQGDGADTSAPH